MTEAEWLACTDPHAMLEFLRISELTSQRKLRLFAVACSRRIWGWIDALGRAAVEVAEGFADGLAGPEELRAARLACQAAGGQASKFFERGSLGYSVTARPDQFDGLELRSFNWQVQPLAVDKVESSFFENKDLFPPDSVEFDCALLMRGIEHEWHGRGRLCAA